MGHGLFTLFVEMTLKSKQNSVCVYVCVYVCVHTLKSRNIKVKFYDSNHLAHLVLKVSSKAQSTYYIHLAAFILLMDIVAV